MRIFSLVFAALFYSSNSFAAITIDQGIAGAIQRIDPITAQISIVAGFNGKCNNPTTGLCNTCVDTDFVSCGGTDAECCGGGDGTNHAKCQMCNTQAVADSTILSIPFRSDTTTTGLPQLTHDSQILDSTSGVGSGGNFIFTARWDDVCQTLTGCTCEIIRTNGTCAGFSGTSVSKTVTIGVQGGDTATLTFKLYRQTQLLASAAPQGALMSYSIYPGDEKVYLESPDVEGYTEGSTSTNLKQIKVFIGTGNFNNAFVSDERKGTGYAVEPAFLNVDSNGVDQVIDGLDNDVLYHFRTASVDEAGNVYAFMDNAYIKNFQINGVNVCPDTALEKGGNDACPFYGTPSEVMGLLSEDLNCFIATAAYGSALDPHIDTFRKFRFKVLLRSEFGKKLNYAYYNYGAKLSHFIHDRQWAQTASRAVLWPTWGLVSLSLYLGLNLWQTLSLFLIAIGLTSLTGFLVIKKILLGRVLR